ncbi:chemotaxis protein CheW [Phycobacter sp. K97]|uniref:chemotaxis protein CheW n=1 Tax=Phycobacter sedimenti TaxID=3133977 RepID=UPI00311F2304
MKNKDMDVTSSDLLLIFRLEGEAFALSVSWVHEILDAQPWAPVPNSGPFAPGLINVRGAVVPVIDIRYRLGLPPAGPDLTGRMIVFEHVIDCVSHKLAFNADSVEQVIEYDLSSLEPVPPLGTSWPQDCLRGVVRHDEELVILLETETTFAPPTEPFVAA